MALVPSKLWSQKKYAVLNILALLGALCIGARTFLVAVVVSVLVQTLRWLAIAAPPRHCCARARARWFAKQIPNWLALTPTFDGLLSELQVEDLDCHGNLRAKIVVTERLLSRAGTMHDGVLAVLVDTVSSLGQIAAGYVPGLSVHIEINPQTSIFAEDCLLVESRILRVNVAMMVLQFDVYREQPDKEPELVTTATHTKSLNAPYFYRLLNNASVRCLPLAMLLMKRDLARLRLEDATSQAAETAEEILAIDCSQDDKATGDCADVGQSRFSAKMTCRQQNSYGIGHGGAIAGLLASAVRDHMKEKRVRGSFKQFSVTYQAPVPGNAEVDLLVVQRTRKSPGQDAQSMFLASELSVQGQVLARANFTIAIAKPEVVASRSPFLFGLQKPGPLRFSALQSFSKQMRQREDAHERAGSAGDRSISSSSSESDTDGLDSTVTRRRRGNAQANSEMCEETTSIRET